METNRIVPQSSLFLEYTNAKLSNFLPHNPYVYFDIVYLVNKDSLWFVLYLNNRSGYACTREHLIFLFFVVEVWLSECWPSAKKKVDWTGVDSLLDLYFEVRVPDDILPWPKKTATTIMHKIKTLFLSRNISMIRRLAQWHDWPRLRASLHTEAQSSLIFRYPMIGTVFWFYA